MKQNPRIVIQSPQKKCEVRQHCGEQYNHRPKDCPEDKGMLPKCEPGMVSDDHECRQAESCSNHGHGHQKCCNIVTYLPRRTLGQANDTIDRQIRNASQNSREQNNSFKRPKLRFFDALIFFHISIIGWETGRVE